MQQRQLRLGDILDDYCPRERRLTNHVVVAMIGDEVRQTRCTTCEADHQYKHAKVPRARKKGDEPAALYGQVLRSGPKRITHEPSPEAESALAIDSLAAASLAGPRSEVTVEEGAAVNDGDAEEREAEEREEEAGVEDGSVHRRLIRATLPRHEGQVAPGRPAPDFTIRQPAGRQNRLRSHGAMGGGSPRGASQRPQGGRPTGGHANTRPPRHHDAGRKRSR